MTLLATKKTCPHCGAPLALEQGQVRVICAYCNTALVVERSSEPHRKVEGNAGGDGVALSLADDTRPKPPRPPARLASPVVPVGPLADDTRPKPPRPQALLAPPLVPVGPAPARRVRPFAVLLPLLCVGLGLAFGLPHLEDCGGFWRSVVPGPSTASTPVVPGWPDAIDPTALLTRARERLPSRDMKLGAIEITYVGANGKVNMNAEGYSPTIGFYFFSVPVSDQKGSLPLGVPRPLPQVPDAWVRVGPQGRLDVHKGNTRETSQKELPSPKCTVADVWERARAKGAPEAAVATVSYRSWGNEARWVFTIGEWSRREREPFLTFTFPDTCGQ